MTFLKNLFNDGFYSAVESYDDRDYDLAAGEIKLPKAPNTYWSKEIQYNQKEVSKVSCTVHGAVGVFSDLTGYHFAKGERKELWSQALEQGAKEAWGWYVDKAVNLVRKHVNQRGHDTVTFRMVLCTDLFWDALDKGYSVVTGYRGNRDYNLDLEADGVLDGIRFPNSTYGHCIRMTSDNKGSVKVVVDNYKGRKHNTYTIKRENLKPLWDNGVFFNSGYIFTRREDFIEKDKKKIHDLWIQNLVNEMKAAGVQTDPFSEKNPEYVRVGIMKKMFDYWSAKTK